MATSGEKSMKKVRIQFSITDDAILARACARVNVFRMLSFGRHGDGKKYWGQVLSIWWSELPPSDSRKLAAGPSGCPTTHEAICCRVKTVFERRIKLEQERVAAQNQGEKREEAPPVTAEELALEEAILGQLQPYRDYKKALETKEAEGKANGEENKRKQATLTSHGATLREACAAMGSARRRRVGNDRTASASESFEADGLEDLDEVFDEDDQDPAALKAPVDSDRGAAAAPDPSTPSPHSRSRRSGSQRTPQSRFNPGDVWERFQSYNNRVFHPTRQEPTQQAVVVEAASERTELSKDEKVQLMSRLSSAHVPPKLILFATKHVKVQNWEWIGALPDELLEGYLESLTEEKKPIS